MSSAGLVRYFDAEDRNTPAFRPQAVLSFGALFGVLVIVLNLMV